MACRRQPLPIQAKRHAADLIRVPFQRERFLTARGVPHLHNLIPAGRDHPFPVRAERHASDAVGMSFNVSASWPVVASQTFTV